MEESIKQLSRNVERARLRVQHPDLPVNDLKTLPTYEELIDYIERDPYKIKYPNRGAEFLRNSFQISSFKPFYN